MEHVFSVEAMVHGYHEYFRASVKFHMGPSSFACYHHQMSNPAEVCLHTHWQKKYLKMVFSHSTLHSGQVETIYQLKIFQQHHPCHSHICVLLITNFLKEKILGKKILAILLQFTKIFSLQNFVSYGIFPYLKPDARVLIIII